MDLTKFDETFTNASTAYVGLPAGNYVATLITCDFRMSKSKKPMFAMEFKVNHGACDGRTVWKFGVLSNNEVSMGFIKRDLAALDIDLDALKGISDPSLPSLLTKAQGRRCLIRVVEKDGNSNVYLNSSTSMAIAS